MPGSAYSAGEAFLAILPSLRGFQQQLQRELRGVNTVYDLLVRPELDRTQTDRVQAQLRATLRALPVPLDIDASPADRELAALRQRIERLAGKTIGIDISGDQARGEIQAIDQDLQRLEGRHPDITVRTDARGARTELAGVSAEVDRLDGRTVRLDVDARRAISDALRLREVLLNVIEHEYDLTIDANTAGAVASIALLIAKVGVLGGLGGVIGGFGGALAGLGAAGAVAGAGAVSSILAFNGVGGALTAMSAQQDAAATTARSSAKQQTAAAYAIAGAQDRVKQASEGANRARVEGARSVSDAEKAAGKQVAQALTAQASAQKSLRAATSDLRREQDTLTDAWEAGRRSLEDLQSQVAGNRLDQRQAALDLKDAEADLAKARQSGDKDAIDRATLAYDRQVQTVKDLQTQAGRLATDNADAQKKGVAGSDQVVAANQRIASAQDRVADSTAAAKAADAAVVTARLDGAESVARAREAADQRVADSNRQVVEAQRALTQAMAQTGDAGAASADKVAAAMAELSPAGRDFVNFLFGAKQQVQELGGVAQTALFPPLQAGLQALLNQQPAISGMVSKLAGSTGGALQTILTTLANPTWMAFFGVLADASTTILPALAQLFLHGADAARELLLGFLPLAPAGIALANQFFSLLQVLTPFLVLMTGALIPAASAFLGALVPLGPVLAALTPILAVLAQALTVVLVAVLQALTPILIALTPLIEQFAMQWAVGLVNALTTATPLLVTVFQFLSDHADTIVTIVTWVGALVGGLGPLTGALGLVLGMLHGWLIWRVISLLLERFGLAATPIARVLELFLHPLGLIRQLLPFIGRALMFLARGALAVLGPFGILLTVLGFLYSSNEQFRDAINGVLRVLMGLATTLLNALMPAFNAIMGAIEPLIPLLINALMPVFNLLIGILVQLVNTVMPPLVGILTSVVIPIIVKLAEILSGVLVWVIQNVVVPEIEAFAWILTNVLIPVITWLWEKIVQPIFKAIGELAVIVFKGILKPIFDWLVWLLEQVVGPAFSWFWQNAVQPAFDGISAAAKWLWENGLKPPFDFIMGYLGALGDFFGWVFEKIIKPIFVGFAEFLSGNVAGLGKIWDGLKALFAAPVKFVLDVVWNAGIGGLWNLAKNFGLPLGEFPKADTSGFAQGGRVPGSSPTKTADNVPAWLTAGEYVQPVDTVDYYGQPVMDALRRRQIPREQIAAYALGGPVTPDEEFAVLRPVFPGVRMTSSYRPGDPGYHGQNKAADFAGPRPGDSAFMMRIDQWIAQHYPASGELIYTPGINLKNGQPHQYSGRVAADHYDHVHWANLGRIGNGSAGSNFSGSGSGTAINWFQQQVQNLFDTSTDAVKALVEPVFPRRGNFVADLPMNSLDWAIGKTRELFFGKAKAEDDKAAAAGAVSGGVGGGVERWRGVVMQALGLMNLPGNLADTTLRRMNQESGGNPRAINNWDVNAKRGTPSKGLMQVIDPTFRANRDPRAPNDIWDPLANVLASMHYAIGRYHSLPAAYDRKGGYDQGGIGKGIGWMWKGTGLDERVLPPQETQAYPTLTRLSQQLEAGRLPTPAGVSDQQYAAALSGTRGSDGAGGDTFNLYDLPYPPERIAREVQRQRDRKARRGGS